MFRPDLPQVMEHHLDFWKLENTEPILLLRGMKGKPSKLIPPVDKTEK